MMNKTINKTGIIIQNIITFICAYVTLKKAAISLSKKTQKLKTSLIVNGFYDTVIKLGVIVKSFDLAVSRIKVGFIGRVKAKTGNICINNI